MSNKLGCRYCANSRADRKNSDGKIRCVRFSKWVEEHDTVCEEYAIPFVERLTADQKMRDAHLLHFKMKEGI